MSGIFNLAQMIMGRPDPQQQLLASLGGGPQPAGRPAAAGASAQPPVPGGAQAAQEPQATKSTADLAAQNQQLMDPGAIMRAMMQMQARNRAEDMFAQGLGNVMSGLSRSPSPAMHQQLMGAFTPQGQIDPTQMMQSYAAIQNFNWQQQQRQAIEDALPGLAKQFPNINPAVLRAAAFSPGGVEQLINNLYGLNDPVSRQMNAEMNRWEQTHSKKDAGGNPIPGQYDAPLPSWWNDPIKFAASKKTESEQQTDQLEAQQKLPGFQANYKIGADTIDRLRNNPMLGKALQYMSTVPGGEKLSTPLASWKKLDPNLYQALSDITQLQGEIYGQAFSSAGARRTQQEVSAIKEGLSQVTRYGYSAEDYIKRVLNPLQEQMDRGLANASGAAQQFDSLPPDLRGYVHKEYLPGGALNTTGVDWASEKGVKMTPDQIQRVKELIDSGESREDVLAHFKNNGFDVSGL